MQELHLTNDHRKDAPEMEEAPGVEEETRLRSAYTHTIITIVQRLAVSFHQRVSVPTLRTSETRA